jgi:hypothetical protein
MVTLPAIPGAPQTREVARPREYSLALQSAPLDVALPLLAAQLHQIASEKFTTLSDLRCDVVVDPRRAGCYLHFHARR